MFFLIVATVLCQKLNSNLTAECSAAAKPALVVLEAACSNRTKDLLSGPIEIIASAGALSALNAALCTEECKAGVNAFATAVAGPCGQQLVFDKSDIPASRLGETGKALQEIGCVKSASGSYCLSSELFPALVAKGYNVNETNTASLATAFSAFIIDPKVACSECANLMVAAVKKNTAAFPEDATLLNATITTITAVCKVANPYKNSDVSSVNFVLASLFTFAIFAI
jgi:hypothetical protein